MNENLFEVLRGFHLDAEPVSCEPYGCGHINVTYLVVTCRPTISATPSASVRQLQQRMKKPSPKWR